jgi:ribosomal protein L11 methyltransferase
MNEQWRELSIIISQTVADVVSDKLIEYGTQGTVFEEIAESPELCKIVAYYPESTDIEDLIQQLQHYLTVLKQMDEEIGPAKILVQDLESRDWNSHWQQFFKPTRVGKHLIIKPSWEDYESQTGDIVIEIDPGMAFGTGLHASTRLAMALLEKYMFPESSVLDVGVGSGILSIAAAHLGAQYVLGVDIDEEAVAIARENVHKNSQLCSQAQRESQERCIELRVGSIDTLEIARQFDCILMNIRPNIIVPLIPYAATYLQTGGALIISGILEEEGPKLLHEIRTFKFVAHHQLIEDGWIAYILSQI